MSPGNVVLLSLTVLIFAFTGCKTPEKQTFVSQTDQEGDINIQPQILTFIFSIQQANDQPLPTVDLYQTITADGYLKSANSTRHAPNEVTLMIELQDSNGKIIQQDRIPHPLKKRYETSDEEGNLQSHELEVEHAYFSVRTQSTSEISQINIFLFHNEQQLLLKQIDL